MSSGHIRCEGDTSGLSQRCWLLKDLYAIPEHFALYTSNYERCAGDALFLYEHCWLLKNPSRNLMGLGPSQLKCRAMPGKLFAVLQALPEAWPAACVQMVRAAGGVTIADEVQSGFGRTGSAYWGFQNQGVTPDIVTMAKGIGNGLPLAAVVTTPEIARSLATRSHLNTFGGNPVCCAGGRAVLQAIDEDRCQENSAKVRPTAHICCMYRQPICVTSHAGDVTV